MNDTSTEQEPRAPEPQKNETEEESLTLKPANGLKQKLAKLVSTKKGKALAGLLSIVVITGILYAVPAARYGILGTFVKKAVTITVIDSQTNKPVSEALVEIAGKSAKSKNDGRVTFDNISVGDYTVMVNKKYYKDSNVYYTVPVFEKPSPLSVSFQATGRQVEVSVVNKITQAPLAKAVIKVSDTSAVTDDKGVAVIVLPPNKPEQDGTISLEGYNELKALVKVTENKDANKLALTPKGTVYFLSKITGKINVMQSDLDGGNAKVVLAGTGREQDRQTVLLAARDWQHLALLSRREGSEGPQLYALEAKSGNLRAIDTKGINIEMVGWWGNRFVYTSSKNLDANGYWQDKTLYSYDADSGKTTTLDATTNAERGVGSNQESDRMSNFYIIDGNVVYLVDWYVPYGAATDKKGAIKQVGVDGSGLKKLKEFPKTTYGNLDARSTGPNTIVVRAWINSTSTEFYEYQNKSVKKVSSNDDDFYNEYYATYLLSPSDNKTFWYEPRNGKNTLFVGDRDGNNSTTLDTLSDYSTYGWYTDDYVMVSKNGSELFIAASKGSLKKLSPVKISDYHKPNVTFSGYGSGYGGF